MVNYQWLIVNEILRFTQNDITPPRLQRGADGSSVCNAVFEASIARICNPCVAEQNEFGSVAECNEASR